MNLLGEAANPATSGARLRLLAQNTSELVRRHVARHANTPIDVLLAMLDDEDCWVAWNLAQNTAAPPELLVELASRRLFLDKVAANRRSPAALLSQLSREMDRQVREAVALNPATPDIVLKGLAKDSEPRVRWCVARNTAADTSLLESLASDTEEGVRRAVARNRNTPSPLKLALKRGFEK